MRGSQFTTLSRTDMMMQHRRYVKHLESLNAMKPVMSSMTEDE